MKVEVIYFPEHSPVIHLFVEVSENASVLDVLDHSGIFDSHPEVRERSVGIFSKLVDYDTKVKNGDRIEIYRPLLINPMEKRRQRAKTRL